ncbi:hypothetical protein [uncultured Vagococcus sp.]|uniref:hypothetical protein n=1 Tax=uncultured Vagococcus sp. TaxID=189676 RepID=UPI0028D207C6|nr:hypothetical protein [uncultured Vagococcus sp.]
MTIVADLLGNFKVLNCISEKIVIRRLIELLGIATRKIARISFIQAENQSGAQVKKIYKDNFVFMDKKTCPRKFP